MSRRWKVAWLPLIALAAASAMSQRAVDAERRGDAAFISQRWREAIEAYESAERTADPGRVAFNLAVTFSRMGNYRDAERAFRASLDQATGARRLRAYYNLGTVLVLASEGQHASHLVEAIDCFRRVMASPDAGAELRDDARHNLELAKLLWKKTSGDAPPPQPPSSPGDDPRGSRTTSNGTPTEGGSPANGTPDPRGPPMPAAGNATPIDDRPPPGSGRLLPIPEERQHQPLPAGEARELLRQAAERIERERRAMLYGAPASESRPYPDW